MKSSRLTYNLEILNGFKKIAEKHPDLRFGQLIGLLTNTTIPIFYEESKDTLEKIKKILRDTKEHI